MSTITDVFQKYLKLNWPTRIYRYDYLKDLAVMGMGLTGEAGEAQEHFKKVVRDYDGNFQAYPPEKRQEALLEYGDTLHYLLKQAAEFGFTLEELMTANMDKLDARYKRKSWHQTVRLMTAAEVRERTDAACKTGMRRVPRYSEDGEAATFEEFGG